MHSLKNIIFSLYLPHVHGFRPLQVKNNFNYEFTAFIDCPIRYAVSLYPLTVDFSCFCLSFFRPPSPMCSNRHQSSAVKSQFGDSKRLSQLNFNYFQRKRTAAELLQVRQLHHWREEGLCWTLPTWRVKPNGCRPQRGQPPGQPIASIPTEGRPRLGRHHPTGKTSTRFPSFENS